MGREDGSWISTSQGSRRNMTRKYRPVADRQKSLASGPPEANFTLAGVRMMYEGGGGEEVPLHNQWVLPNTDIRVSRDRFQSEWQRTSPHDLFVSRGSSMCRFKSMWTTS